MKHLITLCLCFTFVIITKAQNKVGIGNTTPTENLDVTGNIKADTVKANGLKISSGASAGKVLTSDANGNASWQAGGSVSAVRNGLSKNNNGIGIGGALDTATIVSLFNKGFSLNDINLTSNLIVTSNTVFSASQALSPSSALVQTFSVSTNCLVANVELNITALAASTITLTVMDNNNTSLAVNTQSFGTLTNGFFTFVVPANLIANQTYKLSITGSTNAFINYEPTTNPYPNGSAVSIGSTADIAFRVNAFLEETTLQVTGSKVGIGTIIPTEKLEVVGKTKTTNLQVTAGAGANKVMSSDASGNAQWSSGNTLPGSIALTGSISGSMGSSVPLVANTFEFVGPTVNVVLTTNQRVIICLTGVVGKNATTATPTSLDVDAGYQLQPSGSIQNTANFNYVSLAPVFTAANERKQLVFTGTFKPTTAGTYKIGAVLRCAAAGFFNSNDFLSGYFTVINE